MGTSQSHDLGHSECTCDVLAWKTGLCPQWNQVGMLCRGAIPIKTKLGVLVALLAGQPTGKSWKDRMTKLGSAIEDMQCNMLFTAAQLEPHCRGAYLTVVTGISYGGSALVSFAFTLDIIPPTSPTGIWRVGLQ